MAITGATPTETEGVLTQGAVAAVEGWTQGATPTSVNSYSVLGATPFGPEGFGYTGGATPVPDTPAPGLDNDLSNSQAFFTNKADKY